MNTKKECSQVSFIWSLIVGGIIGWLAGLIVGRNIPGGVIGNIIAGFVGAWLGSLILGNWGPNVANFAIIPAVIGAVVLVFLLSLVMRAFRKTDR
ncbi:GlsB/YeaQ/YmgE family stress response membrane protein [Bacillus salipaludis]|uniref:GlsB/YeaQ/YmgE family stress response membrane protein n=1 Tax=Bacillus salipaludis TaxID=2547811 RepID=A0A4R5VKC9_9BACI|nr:GlsB/YeaQ/YmgE family stress response membrane protein [Bacillus salipaludis]